MDARQPRMRSLRTGLHRVLLFALLPGGLGLGTALPLQAAWILDSNALNVNASASAGEPALLMVNDTPYVAWVEEACITWLYCKQEIGPGVWSLLGQTFNGGVINDPGRSASSPSFGYDTGMPWLAWTEPFVNIDGWVKRYQGPVWNDPVGVRFQPPGRSAAHPSLSEDAHYVAYQDVAAQKLQVSIDSMGWVPLGGSLNRDGLATADHPSFRYVNGNPHVAWQEGNLSTTKVFVSWYNGIDWEPLGGGLNISPSALAKHPRLLDLGGRPGVTWIESVGPLNGVFVKQYNGVAWQSMGGDLRVNPAASAGTADIARLGGNVFVLWDESLAGTGSIYMKVWQGANWVGTGAARVNDADPVGGPKLAAGDTLLYATWLERHGALDQVVVKHWVMDTPTPTLTATPVVLITPSPGTGTTSDWLTLVTPIVRTSRGERLQLVTRLPSTGNASLKVFNLNGRLAATLIEGNWPSGDQTVSWDGRGAGSGSYWVRLEFQGQHQQKKFTLVR